MATIDRTQAATSSRTSETSSLPSSPTRPSANKGLKNSDHAIQRKNTNRSFSTWNRSRKPQITIWTPPKCPSSGFLKTKTKFLRTTRKSSEVFLYISWSTSCHHVSWRLPKWRSRPSGTIWESGNNWSAFCQVRDLLANTGARSHQNDCLFILLPTKITTLLVITQLKNISGRTSAFRDLRLAPIPENCSACWRTWKYPHPRFRKSIGRGQSEGRWIHFCFRLSFCSPVESRACP